MEKAFDAWADRIFEDCLPDYGVAMRSDATTLNILHPPDKPSLTRLRVRRKGAKHGAGQDVGQDAGQDAGQDVGWILVARKRMKNNHHFGDLKVGRQVDGSRRGADG